LLFHVSSIANSPQSSRSSISPDALSLAPTKQRFSERIALKILNIFKDFQANFFLSTIFNFY